MFMGQTAFAYTGQTPVPKLEVVKTGNHSLLEAKAQEQKARNGY